MIFKIILVGVLSVCLLANLIAGHWFHVAVNLFAVIAVAGWWEPRRKL